MTDAWSARYVGEAQFPLTGQQAPAVIHVELTGSTQDDLAELWESGSVSAGTVMIADDQNAGRGRVGRAWHSRAGKSLLVSTLIELPDFLDDHIQWVTMAGALAALESVVRHCATPDGPGLAISWPNDVVVLTDDGVRKLGGLLGEVCGRRDGKIACILGWGANLALTAEELPTPTSTSILAAGLSVVDRDPLIATYLEGLNARLDALVRYGNPAEAGLVAEANRVTETLRPGITVGRPLAAPLVGTGVRVLDDASLEMLTEEGSVIVTSGEVAMLGMRAAADGSEQASAREQAASQPQQTSPPDQASVAPPTSDNTVQQTSTTTDISEGDHR